MFGVRAALPQRRHHSLDVRGGYHALSEETGDSAHDQRA
jgi:hypothetical protein